MKVDPAPSVLITSIISLCAIMISLQIESCLSKMAEVVEIPLG